MQELLTKTKFVNALVREHISIEEKRKEFGKERFQEYLRLEVFATTRAPAKTNRLVIRGNQLGTHWMIWEEDFANTPEGMRKLHKAAVELAFAAAQRASEKLKQPVQIGMPPISYFDVWFSK